ncbi:MAG: hypothetical protein R6V14_09710 [Halanaerobiales bacterium]
MYKKILILFILITIGLTPVANAQSHDFQEMKYSVFIDGENTSLNINPVFQFQNELNKLSFDLNFDGDEFKFGGTWLIQALKSEDYETDAAFTVLTKPSSQGITAGLGAEGKKLFEQDRELTYQLKYILENQQFEYRLGYLTPVVENNDLMVSIGNSYWHDKLLLLEVGFRVQF